MAYLKNIKENYIKLFICLLAIISFFSTINILPPLDRDEARYIQSTVQMIESGDFFNINFLDNPRLKKPPGIYWLQAFSSVSVKNLFLLEKPPLWSFRLPSAIAASLSILFVYLLGNIIFGRLQGIIAALLFLSVPIVIIEANIAKTDSVLSCITLAIIYLLAKVIFFKNNEKNLSSLYIYLGWLLLGFSFLIKGPITFIIIFLLVMSFKIIERDFVLSSIKPIYGLILFTIICAPWFIFIFTGNNADYMIGDIKKDFLEKIYSVQESHGAPPGAYIISLFISAWPLAIFLLPTVVWSYLNRKEKSIKFLLCYILPSWIVFELIPTKLLHYLLPLIPGLTLLTAAMIVESIKNNNFLMEFNKRILNIYTFFPIIGIGTIIIVIGYLGIEFGIGFSKEVILIILIFLLIGIFAIYNFYYLNYLRAFFIASIGTILAINLFMLFVPNQTQKIWISERIYEEIENKNLNHSSILFGYSEPSLVYRLGSKTKIAGNTIDVINFINNHKVDYIIIENQYLDEFKILSKENNINFKNISKSISGFNYSKGKNVEIYIISLIL